MVGGGEWLMERNGDPAGVLYRSKGHPSSRLANAIRDALRGRPELPYHIDWNERVPSGLNGLTWMGS
jgi:hypothetical protein